jgi:YqjK-like protein
MDERLIELYVQRGRLRERIGAQRQLIARDLAPLASALGLADRGMAWLHRARAYVQAHPGVVVAVVVAVVVWRPRWVLRSLRWGIVAWRGWRAWRTRGHQVSELFRAFRGTPGAP